MTDATRWPTWDDVERLRREELSRIELRLPPDLKTNLTTWAADTGRSLNDLVRIILETVTDPNAPDPLIEQIKSRAGARKREQP